MSTTQRGITTANETEQEELRVRPIHYVQDGMLWFGFELGAVALSNDTFEMMLKEVNGNARLLKAQLMQRTASRLALELLEYGETLDGNVEIPCS